MFIGLSNSKNSLGNAVVGEFSTVPVGISGKSLDDVSVVSTDAVSMLEEVVQALKLKIVSAKTNGKLVFICTV